MTRRILIACLSLLGVLLAEASPASAIGTLLCLLQTDPPAVPQQVDDAAACRALANSTGRNRSFKIRCYLGNNRYATVEEINPENDAIPVACAK
jgi:hypothetical protein